MSVWLTEVVMDDGKIDFINNPDDAKWLLSQRDEFESMCEKAEECVEDYEEYEEYAEEHEDNDELLSFDEWRRQKKD